MAWTAPLTFLANEVLDASDLNASIRDNMLEMATAKANLAGQYFASSGPNAIEPRMVLQQTAINSTATQSNNFIQQPNGPAINVTHSGSILAMWSARMYRYGSGIGPTSTANLSCEVTGQVNASLAWASRHPGVGPEIVGDTDVARQSGHHLFTGLSPGTDQVRLMYSTSAGSANFAQRVLIVMPF